jgi:competence protein ComEC
LAPLGLLLFGQVSVVGLLANLLAIPWVTLVVTPLALLAAVLPMAASAAAVAMLPLMSLLQWLAALPGAVWALPQPAWWASVLAIAAGLLVIAPLPGRLRLVAALLALPALFWPQAAACRRVRTAGGGYRPGQCRHHQHSQPPSAL